MLRPPRALDDFIEHIWYWEGDPLPHRRELVMASHTAGLLVNLAHDELRHYAGVGYATPQRTRGIALCGPSSRHFAIDAHQPKIMGVQFKPGGVHPFFAPSARLLTDAHVALEDIWGPAACRLHHRLVEAPTAERKIGVLCGALMARMRCTPEIHPVVSLALDRFDGEPFGARVGAVAAEAGLSRRRFIGVFAEHVGFTPKLYLRVRRFQSVLKRVFGATGVDWSEVAYLSGYADQPHFNRDFKSFSGLTPSQYLARRGSGQNHAALVEVG